MTKKMKTFEAPAMEIILLTTDVIATSGDMAVLTHGQEHERDGYGLGGFVNSSDWYGKHQN